ncbi:RNA polymerase sigma-70 factor (ECF subfamily) [Paenibacillus cellulosilyticus]|uniref:RNA polymerase sigma-70 factor (ECF subfamily) n=1 Tax=Paenibacillus cellulosilyticus TaxID=375489 RepID=A0A2V2YN32_9BACL|nr:sigma-70 family RNA polymerase sigma factor [Paenibacillus cellulosilyticus]PWV95705.1 RNA polymerase sigma-70 factor (ECF subfamily) [Paenibacillus cellulosilyticus]QKS47661.1 sigma-70 family RNA polymerase sigma factor [Paenibacillus cellulosilyticus]
MNQAEDQERMHVLVKEQQHRLKRFCRKLAGSNWDADDLAQTTWMKIWRQGAGSRPVSSSYLYRVAANAWIDLCRKRRLACEELTEQLADRIMAEDQVEVSPELTEAMSAVVSLLPPRQRMVLLFIEGLQFTAGETAVLLEMSEGAVKAALHRARTKLDGWRQERAGGRRIRGKRMPAARRSYADEAVVYAYLNAFRTRNVTGLLLLLNADESQDVLPAVQGAHVAPVQASAAVDVRASYAGGFDTLMYAA